MNNKIVWVKIQAQNYYSVFIKLNDIGITIYDNKKEKDYILIKTAWKDYKRLKKYLVSYEIELYDNSGIFKIKDIIKKYQFFTMGIILGIIILLLSNNIIFKVEIKSANKNIQNLLKEELKEYGLTTLRLKKSHHQVEKIVNKILDNNKDTLEWLEIKYDGLIMIVNVTEKNLPKDLETYDHCNLIAKKDAKILSLNIYRGMALKEINDYVLKGDIILSGDIIHNEEVKNMVCATGEVYGEVWYKVKVEVPLKENYINYTGKNRFNLSLKINDNKYDIFKSRIENKKTEEINLYKLNDFEINLVKEKEFVNAKRELTEDEAYKKGINLAIEKINLTLNDNEKIIYQKVLKNEVNDSTIYLEIFIATKENIGEVSIIKGGNVDGSESSETNNE